MSTNQLVIFVILAALVLFALRPLFLGGPRVTAAEAQARIQAGSAVLVDVRESGEWSDGVAGPAVLLPMSDLRGGRAQWSAFLDANREKELILYCASGMRSGTVAAALRKEGFKTANLGGFGTWAGAGLPVRKP